MTDQAEPSTQPTPDTESDSLTAKDLAVLLARMCDDKQAREIVVLDVKEALQVVDYFVIAEGKNRRHIGVLAENASMELKKQGLYRMHGTPMNDEHWVVLDYGPVVLHCMSPDARGFYDLENLWGDCEQIPWKDETAAPAADETVA